MKRRTRLNSKSKRKRKLDAVYAGLRAKLLKERPICECWLEITGWHEVNGQYFKFGTHEDGHSVSVSVRSVEDMLSEGAPRSEECHHKRGRGKYYLAYDTFMAVSHDWHTWIETHKSQAIAKGWLHPMKNRRPIELPAK